MNKLGRWYKRARDVITGRFITLADAMKRARTTIVERIKRG